MNPRILRAFLSATLIIGSPLFAAHDTSVDELIRMHQSGLSDATILSFVRESSVCLPLSSPELSRMVEAGLSHGLINALVPQMRDCPPGARGPYTYPVPLALRYPATFYSSLYVSTGFFPTLFLLDHQHPVHHDPHHVGIVGHGVVHPKTPPHHHPVGHAPHQEAGHVPPLASAEPIYKSVDAQGNVIYSSKPPPDARQVKEFAIQPGPTAEQIEATKARANRTIEQAKKTDSAPHEIEHAGQHLRHAGGPFGGHGVHARPLDHRSPAHHKQALHPIVGDLGRHTSLTHGLTRSVDGDHKGHASGLGGGHNFRIHSGGRRSGGTHFGGKHFGGKHSGGRHFGHRHFGGGHSGGGHFGHGHFGGGHSGGGHSGGHGH